jgi:hypothetical protein
LDFKRSNIGREVGFYYLLDLHRRFVCGMPISDNYVLNVELASHPDLSPARFSSFNHINYGLIYIFCVLHVNGFERIHTISELTWSSCEQCNLIGRPAGIETASLRATKLQSSLTTSCCIYVKVMPVSGTKCKMVNIMIYASLFN